MKKLICLFALLLIFGACKSSKHCQKSKAISSKTLIPYEIGNYWVYKSVELNQIDTLKVVSHQQSDEGLKVDLNFEKWLIKGDTIFVRCQSRGAAEFSMPLYLKTDKGSSYTTCMGDVVMEVKASKLKEDQNVNGKTYTNCYLFEILPYRKVIIADGIGIIRSTYQDAEGKEQMEAILLDYKLK
jgi:hypothetical protein